MISENKRSNRHRHSQVTNTNNSRIAIAFKSRIAVAIPQVATAMSRIAKQPDERMMGEREEAREDFCLPDGGMGLE